MNVARGEDTAPPPRDAVFASTLVCFFLSGFAALLYQTVWTRQFAFVFGTADLAIATVLAAYMGGLAVGAAVASWFASTVRRPLVVYGVLELVIAAAALLVPLAIGAATAVAVACFGGHDAPPSASGPALALFYAAAAFLVLLVPTTAMGATLPLLARAAVRSDGELAARVGTLYAVNTAGAVAGTIAAAFVLLPRLGLHRTVLVGVALNAVVCALAVFVARRGFGAESDVVPRTSPPVVARYAVVLPLLLISGVTSFTYEVVWTRLLGHILGGSTYAFATMLATFLTGIALGAAAAARLATTRERAARGFAIAQLGIAAGSLAAFRAMDALPALAVGLGAGRAPDQPGNALLAGLVMLPSTLAIGATFPLAVRALAAGSADAGPASARAYAWNTSGAIVGALGAGFFAMPWLGYAGVIAAATAVNLLLALAMALVVTPRAPLIAALAAVGVVMLAWSPPEMPWTLIGSSPLAPGRGARPPEFFAVGRSAGVAVAFEGGVYKLRTNGLPEGVMLPPRRYRRAIPDRWLGALPALARPDARRALVVGLGAGTALEAVARTLTDIDVVELEPRVIEANERYRSRRAVDPLALPGLHLQVNDARGALALTDKRYDVLISQPSHPWTAGASHLYTREFFALARDHLAPAGVFVQWIDLEIVDADMLRTLVATLLDVFPQVRVYRPFFRGTALFLASDAPLAVEEHAAAAIAASSVELARAGIQTREDAAAALGLDETGARALAEGAELTTDDRNLLETRSVRVRAPLGYQGTDQLLAPLDPLPGRLANLDRVYLVRRLLADWDFPRAGRVVQAIGDPVERLTASGLVALATERIAEGRTSLRGALAQDAGAYEARIALLRSERAALAAGSRELTALAADLADPAAAVVAGWARESKNDWDGVRALEPRLASALPRDAAYGDALRLRAAWRVASGDPAAAVEALALIDRVLPMSVDPDDYIRRARAARVAGDAGAALESLTQTLEATTPGFYRTMAARVAVELAALPPLPELATPRGELEAQLSRLR